MDEEKIAKAVRENFDLRPAGIIKELDLQNYLFNVDANELPPQTRLDISSSLRREMIEIFSGRNIY